MPKRTSCADAGRVWGARILQRYYGTGRSAQARETTLWIDTETFLLCKMLEDTPEGAPAGTVQRVTTTIEPQVNPDLADDAFRFEPPQS